MKILFLYPGMELTGRYKDVIKGVAVPPQGICQLAGVTRALGHETAILDAMVLELDTAPTVAQIVGRAPDLLGISATTKQIGAAGEIARQVKARLPRTIEWQVQVMRNLTRSARG